MKSLLLRSGVAAVTVAALLYGCSNPNNPLNAGNRAAPAPQSATVTERDIVGQIPLGGEIVVPPPAQANVYPPFRAAVQKVDASLNTQVSKGDVLVQLALPSAEAYHELTKATLQQAQADYDNARKQYEAPMQVAKQQLDAARAAEKSARQAGSGVDVTLEGSSGTTVSTDLASATAQRQEAERDYLQAKADFDAAVLPYQQRLAEATANNNQARASEKQGYVRAPISGMVTVLNAQPGREVGADRNQPVATIVDLSALQIHAVMTAEQAAHVKLKMECVVTFDELPGKTFEGTVSRITSQPNNAGYVAIVQFKNAEPFAKPGYHPHVGVKTGEKADDVPAVPAAAVDYDTSGKPTVKVLRDNKWQTVAVQPGITDGQFTEIRFGVQKGDMVQVTP